MSFRIGERVKYRNMKCLGTVLQGNDNETLVHFDDGDRCAVDTFFLTGVVA